MEIEDQVAENITPFLNQGVEFIHEAKTAGKNILVHCIQGMSRSTTMVLGYLMKHEKMSLKNAWEHTKGIRRIVKPNPSFVKALMAYELELFG